MPDLLKQIESSGAQYSIKQADVIVLTIGGNDLFPGWESLGKIDLETYRPDTETFQNEAKKIIEEIRKLNTDSPIFWLGLYNPFEDVEDLKGSSNIVVDWNASLEKLAINNKMCILHQHLIYSKTVGKIYYTPIISIRMK